MKDDRLYLIHIGVEGVDEAGPSALQGRGFDLASHEPRQPPSIRSMSCSPLINIRLL